MKITAVFMAFGSKTSRYAGVDVGRLRLWTPSPRETLTRTCGTVKAVPSKVAVTGSRISGRAGVHGRYG